MDIHCYVMVERMVMFEHTCYEGAKTLKVQETIPTVCKYVEDFKKYPLFAEHCITVDAF